jgi:membrane protease YdiL (CAAX protease family)
LVTRLLFQKNLREFGWGWGKTRYQLLSYGLPFLIISVVYAVVWTTGLGEFSPDGYAAKVSKELGLESSLSLGLSILIIATLGLVANSAAALGEELGWRGFLVPELAKTNSFHGTAMISGLIWAIWHYPIIIWADYSQGVPAWYALPTVTVMFVGMSTIMAWIRLKSGSMWTAVIFHAAHNLFIQAIFGQMTTDLGNTNYFASEFGILAAIAYGCVASYLCWKQAR